MRLSLSLSLSSLCPCLRLLLRSAASVFFLLFFFVLAPNIPASDLLPSKHSAFGFGEFVWIDTPNKSVAVYLRDAGFDRMIVGAL